LWVHAGREKYGPVRSLPVSQVAEYLEEVLTCLKTRIYRLVAELNLIRKQGCHDTGKATKRTLSRGWGLSATISTADDALFCTAPDPRPLVCRPPDIGNTRVQ